MNELLHLKGKLMYSKNHAVGGGGIKLPKYGIVYATHLNHLCEQLKQILAYWQSQSIISGALFSAFYKQVIAKSNRIEKIFPLKGDETVNQHVIGAKFWYHGENIGHVLTYFFEINTLIEGISQLELCKEIVEKHFKGQIDYAILEEIKQDKITFPKTGLPKSNFIKIIGDAYYVMNFNIETYDEEIRDNSLITLYETNVPTKTLLNQLGITGASLRMLDKNTFLLRSDEIEILKQKVPYLIAMKTRDLGTLSPTEFLTFEASQKTIPSPTNEPTIGVIDTPFDERSYFHEWVTCKNMIPKEIGIDFDDYKHGTSVSSIIVDGPSLNPSLEDGCGRFKVMHYGVAKAGHFSTYSILQSIRTAIREHPEIKVWNLSLGSVLEVNPNFISPEAAELDKIQTEHDVIFVISGTNDELRGRNKKIGAPADSLNALVVNSVDKSGAPASYHRLGPVLSFFNKPDVSTFGGDRGDYINVFDSTGIAKVTGTSYAAPWIARKLAYLIHIMGFSKEVAKALIIDSACGWHVENPNIHSIGWGTVPKHINDIITTSEDEIRFIINGSTEEYETFTYDLPIPQASGKHPFFARAVLCSFPTCDRNQGVDYTKTEMDIHFGRVRRDKDGKLSICSIDANRQGDRGFHHNLTEKTVREIFRKWDNVKILTQKITSRTTGYKVYDSGNWGLSIKTKERLTSKNKAPLPFGIVITLKETTGKNRIKEFIQLCQSRGWIVNSIHLKNQINVYNKAEEELYLE